MMLTSRLALLMSYKASTLVWNWDCGFRFLQVGFRTSLKMENESQKFEKWSTITSFVANGLKHNDFNNNNNEQLFFNIYLFREVFSDTHKNEMILNLKK